MLSFINPATEMEHFSSLEGRTVPVLLRDHGRSVTDAQTHGFYLTSALSGALWISSLSFSAQLSPIQYPQLRSYKIRDTVTFRFANKNNFNIYVFAFLFFNISILVSAV